VTRRPIFGVVHSAFIQRRLAVVEGGGVNKRLHGIAIATLLLSLAASGCGGSGLEEPADEAGATETSEASTTTTLAFTTEIGVALAPPGASTVAMLDVRYEPSTVGVTAGDVVLWLYRFHCSVGTHTAHGMHGALEVAA
jgi:hypothetical protein